ncbi:MAG: hypothetical protein HYV63_05390, partial [Candidatus Schekmanbacteria bacterium]|nr:hypothetical protein [Candidatus Schekmanbacteria bacterium]
MERIKEDERDSPMHDVPIEARARAYLAGTLTLADLCALERAELYELAEHGRRVGGQGQLADAQQIFEALVVLDPYDPFFHTALGAVYTQRGDEERALREYDRALAIDNGHLPALVNQAELFVGQQRWEDVTRNLTRVFA